MISRAEGGAKRTDTLVREGSFRRWDQLHGRIRDVLQVARRIEIQVCRVGHGGGTGGFRTESASSPRSVSTIVFTSAVDVWTENETRIGMRELECVAAAGTKRARWKHRAWT